MKWRMWRDDYIDLQVMKKMKFERTEAGSRRKSVLQTSWNSHHVGFEDKGTPKVDTLWLFNIAMDNGPFIDGLPIKNGGSFHGYVK